MAACTLGLACGPAAAAPATPRANGTPPAALPEGAFMLPPGTCPFDVSVSLSGKSKLLQLPGRTIITSPGAEATLTNTASGDSVTLKITGSFHQTPSGANTVTVTTGRSLLLDTNPLIPPGEAVGLVLAVGRFTFTQDPGGLFLGPPTGQGQLVKVCDLIA